MSLFFKGVRNCKLKNMYPQLADVWWQFWLVLESSEPPSFETAQTFISTNFQTQWNIKKSSENTRKTRLKKYPHVQNSPFMLLITSSSNQNKLPVFMLPVQYNIQIHSNKLQNNCKFNKSAYLARHVLLIKKFRFYWLQLSTSSLPPIQNLKKFTFDLLFVPIQHFCVCWVCMPSTSSWWGANVGEFFLVLAVEELRNATSGQRN